MKTKISIFALLLLALPVFSHAAYRNADVNTDGCVDSSDYTLIREDLGTATSQSDLDSSGVVNLRDLTVLMHTWAPCSNTVDAASFFPFAPNKNLRFNYYNPTSGAVLKKYEVMRVEPWSDAKHFTVHHYYANLGEALQTCPRVDDVFAFQDDKLFYTDTYNFYDTSVDPNGLTRAIFPQGDLWAQTTMVKGQTITRQAVPFVQNTMTHSNCSVTQETQKQSIQYQTEVVITDQTSWSPYTGGSSKAVPTLMLQQTTTYFAPKSKTSLFQEQWHFYRDPTYGYIPIDVVILSKSTSQTALKAISHQRLESVGE